MCSYVVLLRHGEREDYTAAKKSPLGGLEWIENNSTRPWDPELSASGRLQANAAAERLKSFLSGEGFPTDLSVFSSPLVRCVETATIVTDVFGIDCVLVEEGISETVCEGWFRQWAVPGADSTWGGPPTARMPKEYAHKYDGKMHGPEVDEKNLHPAAMDRSSWYLNASELKKSFVKVDELHTSCAPVGGELSWGKFETRDSMCERVLKTVMDRAQQHLEEVNQGKTQPKTLVFVSHGGPTTAALEGLTAKPKKGKGGMTAMSILRLQEGCVDDFVNNDAEHAAALVQGEEPAI